MNENKLLSNVEKIRDWFKTHSVTRDITGGVIETIPIIGSTLKNIFDNATEPEDEKIKLIIEMLGNLEKLNDGRLESISNQLINNENQILKNHRYLEQFTVFLSNMITKLEQVENKIQEGNMKIQLDVANLHLEFFNISGEMIQKIDEIHPLLQEIPVYTHRIMITPKIISALKLGEASVLKGKGENAIEIYAESLRVTSFYKQSNKNDIQKLLNALSARHGKIISESFLLGRQLAILFGTFQRKSITILGNYF